MNHQGLRWLAAFAAVVSSLGFSSVARAADSLSLSTSPASPTDAGFQIVATGTTSSGATLSVQYRPDGTGNCTQDPTSNNGTLISPDGAGLGTGSFDVPGSPETVPIGSYVLCGWLTDDASAVTASFSGKFTVSPADTLSLSTTSNPIEGEPIDVTAAGNAYDQNAQVDTTVGPAGGACPANPPASADSNGTPVGGQLPFSVPVISQQTFDPGTYLTCAWLVDDSTTQEVLTTTQMTFTVGVLQASFQLMAPAKVDPGQTLTLNLVADLPANVPVIAVADFQSDRAGAHCAANPDGEPASATNVLDQSITDTQAPSGDVSASNSGPLPGSGAYLFCGWLEAGWTSDTNPPVVSGPASTIVSSARPQVYRGRTSQHMGIAITVSSIEHDILAVTYADHLRCGGSPTFPDGERWNGNWRAQFTTKNFGTIHVAAPGRFAIKLNGNRKHTFDLSGRLVGKRITGILAERGTSLAFTENTAQKMVCTTGPVRFSARTH